MTKKAMISQPMAGKTEEEIKEACAKAVEYLESKGYKVVDNYVEHTGLLLKCLKSIEVKHEPIWFLGSSISNIAHCDLVFFCKGWENARGCRIEHEVAKEYGLDIAYEI